MYGGYTGLDTNVQYIQYNAYNTIDTIHNVYVCSVFACVCVALYLCIPVTVVLGCMGTHLPI